MRKYDINVLARKLCAYLINNNKQTVNIYEIMLVLDVSNAVAYKVLYLLRNLDIITENKVNIDKAKMFLGVQS